MSVREPLLYKSSKSLLSRFSDTGKWTVLPWPEMFTLSHTTDTLGKAPCNLLIPIFALAITSQKKVSLSLGRSPLVSSMRKSLLMNFLKPQSFPWTNLNDVEKTVLMCSNFQEVVNEPEITCMHVDSPWPWSPLSWSWVCWTWIWPSLQTCCRRPRGGRGRGSP